MCTYLGLCKHSYIVFVRMLIRQNTALAGRGGVLEGLPDSPSDIGPGTEETQPLSIISSLSLFSPVTHSLSLSGGHFYQNLQV